MSGRLRALTIRLPEPYLESLEELVRSGLYVSVSEAIRMAVRDMISRESHISRWRER
ncbi:MAG: ribbon-helix-helix domain-containing protein [Nitrososphaerota archaeon]